MSTILELTNILLRRLGEVELTDASFASAKGIQATAKDCVIDSISEILSRERFWSFLWHSVPIDLNPGQSFYEIEPALVPLGLDGNHIEAVNWKNARLFKNDDLGVDNKSLMYMTYEDYRRNLRRTDLNSFPDGRGIPSFIVSTPGDYQDIDGDVTITAYPSNNTGFIVSPAPDKAYRLILNVYLIVNNNYRTVGGSSVEIPTRWNYVIINGALKHFYAYKDNSEQSQIWMGEFEKSISQMRNVVVPKLSDMTDTRVSYGGDDWRSRQGW